MKDISDSFAKSGRMWYARIMHESKTRQ